MITEIGLKNAIKSSIAEQRRITLRDPGLRGSGRFVAIARPRGDAVTCEFYVVWQRAGKRQTAKLGNYPDMTIKQGRALFQEQYCPEISDGIDPLGPRAVVKVRGQTVLDLFQAYHEDLETRGKRSARDIYRLLLGPKGAVHTIGPDRLARHVEPKHMIPHLAVIRQRGSAGQANMVRAYLQAAFKFGMTAPNSYHGAGLGMDWGLKHNPAALINTDPGASRPRHRVLTRSEFANFYMWLEDHAPANHMASAVQLMMLTGQRPDEVMQICRGTISADGSEVVWPTTKNDLPHSIPLVGKVKAIVESLAANEHGLFFARPSAPSARAEVAAPRRLVHAYIDATDCEPFTCHDLRRTWKTLAGDAGIAKAARDIVQNHQTRDVSSVHYDRYDYRREKQVAMLTWDQYVTALLEEHAPRPAEGIQHFGAVFTFDIHSLELRKGGVRVRTGLAERTLLSVFLRHVGDTLTLDQLVEMCASQTDIVTTGAIKLRVSRLRRVLGASGGLIQMCRNAGYKFGGKPEGEGLFA